ncbi:hypothetical protein MXB_1422 [Myxobolus squamalis]|nr:hypothetical protein MXB_1422 [Myxobolus squamalis]
MAITIDDISDVKIDGNGRFKYIMIRIEDSKCNKKLIIRGFSTNFHADIAERYSLELEESGLKIKIIGGGTILHLPEKNKIVVYGYSMVIQINDSIFRVLARLSMKLP